MFSMEHSIINTEDIKNRVQARIQAAQDMEDEILKRLALTKTIDPSSIRPIYSSSIASKYIITPIKPSSFPLITPIPVSTTTMDCSLLKGVSIPSNFPTSPNVVRGLINEAEHQEYNLAGEESSIKHSYNEDY